MSVPQRRLRVLNKQLSHILGQRSPPPARLPHTLSGSFGSIRGIQSLPYPHASRSPCSNGVSVVPPWPFPNSPSSIGQALGMCALWPSGRFFEVFSRYFLAFPISCSGLQTRGSDCKLKVNAVQSLDSGGNRLPFCPPVKHIPERGHLVFQ